MAVDRGEFRNVYMPTPGAWMGMFVYPAATAQTAFYAGEFVIDTGYDDPVGWTLGVQAAEVYGCRVYSTSATINNPGGASSFSGTWQIESSPMYAAHHYVAPAPVSRPNRVYIRCEARLINPVSKTNGSYQRLTNVDWTLYRV